MRNTSCYLLFPLSLLLLTACGNRRAYDTMHRYLLNAKAENQQCDSFTKDTLMQTLTTYFDRYGTPNDRLLAHYLMGRAYADRHNVPMAIGSYMTAIACADTTRADCDYAQLARVYIQAAILLYDQNLVEDQLQCIDFSMRYAWRAKDTLCALTSYEQKMDAYELRNMPDSVIAVGEHVYQQYLQYGYDRYAARALGGFLLHLIERGDYGKGKQYLDIYREKSGFFDEHGNIERGRESFYYAIGAYYMAINATDSAEFFFRKALLRKDDFNCQNAGSKGLALLYQKTHVPDSAAKYALYSYAMNDSMHAEKVTYEVKKIESLYDYTQYRIKADEERQRAETVSWKLRVSLLAFLFFSIGSALILLRVIRKRREAVLHALQLQTSIERLESELMRLREHETESELLIRKKETELAEKKEEIRNHRTNGHRRVADNILFHSAEYAEIEDYAVRGERISETEWQKIEQMTEKFLPGFSEFLNAHSKDLNKKEYRTCVLSRLHFHPSNICHMLGVSQPYISKIRAEMLYKLFGKRGSAKEFDKRIQAIY